MTTTSRKPLSASATPSQIARLVGQLSSQLPAKKLSGDAAQFWIRNPKKVKKLLSLLSSIGDNAELIPTGPMFETLSELVESVGSGELLFGDLLKGLNTIARGEEKIAWPIWKTVQLGGYKTNKGLKDALIKRGSLSEYFHHTESAMTKSISLSSEKTSLNLILLFVEELGFSNRPAYPQILEAGERLGLKPCPAETAALVCLQHDKLWPGAMTPDDRYALVAMEPIRSKNARGGVSRELVFVLEDSKDEKEFPSVAYERVEGKTDRSLEERIIFSI